MKKLDPTNLKFTTPEDLTSSSASVNKASEEEMSEEAFKAKMKTLKDEFGGLSEEEQVKKLTTEQDPAEIFASLFYIYFPRFSALVGKMSNRGLRRLLRALLEVPLNDKPYKMLEKEEREAFAIANRLQESKYLLQFSRVIDDLNAKDLRESSVANVEKGETIHEASVNKVDAGEKENASSN